MARTFKRKEGSLSFTASTQTRLQLSRNYHVESYLVKIKVTHTNGASPKFYNEGVLSLINGIQLVGNGNENIKQIPGNKLYIDAILSNGKQGKTVLDTTASTSGLVSYVWAKINLSMPNSVRPWDTILNTGVFQSLDLIVDWGSSANMGEDITITAADMTVYSNQLIGYTRGKGEVIKYYEETALKEEVTSTNSEFTITLPINKLYRSLVVAATVDNIRSGNVIKGLKVKSGTTVIVDWDSEALNEFNKEHFRIEGDQDFTGIYVIDFAERGRLSDVLNTLTGGFNTLELVLDVEKQSGSNFVQVYSDTVKQTSITEA
ncbi:hypothetical protein [Sulfurospirillum sp. 1612]|uniref:hypothetical protein n=1 Tax=Sulfurospirillum sp. 1612 TaxID=3094835 RepID=UPI002F940684